MYVYVCTLHRAFCRMCAVPSQTGTININYRLPLATASLNSCTVEPCTCKHSFFSFVFVFFQSLPPWYSNYWLPLDSGVVPASHHASCPGTRLICERYPITPRGCFICCRCGVPNLGLRVRFQQLHTYFLITSKLTNRCTAPTTNHRLFLPESPNPSFTILC